MIIKLKALEVVNKNVYDETEYEQETELEISFINSEDMIMIEVDGEFYKVNVDDLIASVRLVGDR